MDLTAARTRLREIQESVERYGVFDLTERDVYWLLAQVRAAIFAWNGFDARGQAERLVGGPCRHEGMPMPKTACAVCLEDALLEAFFTGASAPREAPPAETSGTSTH